MNNTINMINDKEFAFKFLQFYPIEKLDADFISELVIASHHFPFNKRSAWILEEAGIVCEEGLWFRILDPKRFLFAKLKYG